MTKPRYPAAAEKRRTAWLAGLAIIGAWALSGALSAEGLRPARESQSGAGAGVPAAGLASGPRRGWAFWKHVLVRVYEQITEDRVLSLAAGVVFYGLLAIFPAITALVSSYALFADPTTIGNHLALLQDVMPAGGYSIVQEQVNRIISGTTGELSLAFFVSLAVALWSANAGLKAIIDALNIVYGVKEERSFIWLNVVSLAMTVCTIAGLMLAIASVVVVPVVLSYLPFGGSGATIIAWVRWPGMILLLMIALALLYRFGPNCAHPCWQLFSVGSVFAALAWLAGSLALSFYLSDFANYNATYGSLGAAIGLMMWLWVTAIVVLVGAEFNAVIAETLTHRHRPSANLIGGD